MFRAFEVSFDFVICILCFHPAFLFNFLSAVLLTVVVVSIRRTVSRELQHNRGSGVGVELINPPRDDDGMETVELGFQVVDFKRYAL